ncbi:MAG: PDZ domain-containing protein, partial [Planctomycetota bacterium]
MSRQNGISLHRVGRRCVSHVAGAMLLTVLAMLPWEASAQPAQDARQEDALGESGKADSPTPQPAIAHAKSPDEQEQTVDNSSPAQGVTSVVVGPDEKPVEGAEVYLFAEATWHPVFSKPSVFPFAPPEDWHRRHALDTLGRARTDAAGRFAMQPESLRPESWQPQLMVVTKGVGFACQVWDQAAGDVEIRLPSAVPIRGRLVTPDGRPAEGVTVRVAKLIERPKYDLKVCQCSLDGDHLAKRYLPEFWPHPARTDAEGFFTLEGIPAGTLVFLHLLHPDYAPAWIDVDTRLRPGEEAPASAPDTFPPEFSLRLKAPRPVEGVVTAADTGKPLAGVLVQVTPGIRHSMGGHYYGRTDEKGRYRFHCRAEGRWGYDFNVYPSPESGYLAAHSRYPGWPEGARSVVKDFQLDRGKLIRGRVLDEETGKPIPAAGVVYRPSKASPHRYGDYVFKMFKHPALTDDDGRFALTGLGGPGLLLVETPDRSYVRLPDQGVLPIPSYYRGERPMPVGLTPVDVPSVGMLEQEVVIRLRRGRRVTLQAVGPRGERLPWVRATWGGIDANYDGILNLGRNFPDGSVVLPDIDPSHTTRVFLICNPRKLGAVFDVTPETTGDPVEVRLQPTATVVGRAVTQAGKPVEDVGVRVMMSFDPTVSQFTNDRYVRTLYRRYAGLSREYAKERGPHPAGRFTLEYIVPGVTFGLAFGHYRQPGSERDILTLEPLRPGERRNVGKLVIPPEPTRQAASAPRPSQQPKPGSNPQKLLQLAMRIGIVPDFSEAGEDRPPKLQVLSGSPAEKAGIRSGDRVTAINGRPVKRIEEAVVLLSRLLSDDALGRSLVVDGLRLSLLREGKQVEAKLTSDLLPGFFGPKVEPLSDDLFEVTFTYQPQKPAEAVYLAGSFNDWNKTAHKMEG